MANLVATDSSGNGHHGVMAGYGLGAGGVSFANAGKENTCWTLNTGPAFAQLPDNAAFRPAWNEAWTLTFWWYGALPTQAAFFSNSDGAAANPNQFNGIEVNCYGGALTCFFNKQNAFNGVLQTVANPVIAAATWHLVAVTYAGTGGSTDFLLRIDKVNRALGASGTTLNTTPVYSQVTTYIGKRADGNVVTSAGARMDMLAFWKGRALSTTDLDNLFDNPTSAYLLANQSANLSAFYEMDESEIGAGFTSPMGSALTATFKGQFVDLDTANLGQGNMVLGFLDPTGFSGDLPLYFVGRAGLDAPSPTVSTIQAKNATLELVFDHPVNIGGSIIAREATKDPLIASLTQTSATQISVNWTLSVPTLQFLGTYDAKVVLGFDIPVNAGAPVLHQDTPLDPLLTSVIQASPDIIYGNWTLPPSVATLLSATSKDDRISLVFDNPVAIGTPALSRINAKDPDLTGMNTVGADAIDVLWTLSVPKVTAVGAIDSKLTVDFDLPVLIGTPTIDPTPDGWEPQISGLIQGAVDELIFSWILPHPALQSVASKDVGVEFNFDLPVSVGAPVFPAPESPQDPLFASATQVSATNVRGNWTLATLPVVSLVTTIVFKVSITWDKPITLTPSGLLPGAWTFTPAGGSNAITCSAVSPNIDGVTVDLTVSMMTVGVGNYTVHIPPGVVQAAGGVTNVAASVIFNGADVAFSLASAAADGSNAVLVTYNDPPNYSTALVALNYSIDNGLNVLSVEAVLPASVRLHTNEMDPGMTYTLTVSNVTDPAGNPLV